MEKDAAVPFTFYRPLKSPKKNIRDDCIISFTRRGNKIFFLTIIVRKKLHYKIQLITRKNHSHIPSKRPN